MIRGVLIGAVLGFVAADVAAAMLKLGDGIVFGSVALALVVLGAVIGAALEERALRKGGIL